MKTLGSFACALFLVSFCACTTADSMFGKAEHEADAQQDTLLAWPRSAPAETRLSNHARVVHSKAPEGNVRVTLQTSVRVLMHPQTRRRVLVVGTHHMATAAYFRSLERPTSHTWGDARWPKTGSAYIEVRSKAHAPATKRPERIHYVAMEVPSHWPALARLLGNEEWFAQFDDDLSRGAGPRSFLEKQLRATDYGCAVASWLAWADSRGGCERFLEVLRDRRSRADRRQKKGEQYRWRQTLDELQVGYLIDQQTRLAIKSTEEPGGRAEKVLDWRAVSPSKHVAFFEVKSLFEDPFSDLSGAEVRRIESADILHGPFQKAVGKFCKGTRNAYVLVTHEPQPDAEDAIHFLYGPSITRVTFDDRGRTTSARAGLDGSPGGAAKERPKKMYAHFNLRDNTRVGGVVFAHPRPDGTARILLFHNPWTQTQCSLPAEWFDPWCQVSATIDNETIRFAVRGEWPADLPQPDYLCSP